VTQASAHSWPMVQVDERMKLAAISIDCAIADRHHRPLEA
jgi:hypothetical protein